MLSGLRTFLVVTLLAVVFWLFAEAESLGQFSGLTSIRFVGGEGGERYVRTAEGFDESVTIDLTGTKSAVARAGLLLSKGLALEPGMPGVPGTDGRHSVNLLQALQSHKELSETGARVTSVRPLLVDVVVTELTTQEVPIEAALPGVEVVGAVKVTPERARLRLPRAAWELTRETLRVSSRVPEPARRGLPVSGPARVDAILEAPESVVALPGFAMLDSSATLEFIVRSQTSTAPAGPAPVQVLLPPVEVGKWIVEVEGEDRFLDVSASGPAERVERLRRKEAGVVGVVTLSSDDLEQRVTSKPVTLMVLAEGELRTWPEVELTTPTKAVRFRIAPIEAAANGAGPGGGGTPR